MTQNQNIHEIKPKEHEESESVDDAVKKLREKYQTTDLNEDEYLKDTRTFQERAKEDYGVRLEGIRNPWDRIKRYTKKFEKVLTESVLETDDPKKVLNVFENTCYFILNYLESEKGEAYLKSKINKRVNSLLKHKLRVIQHERSELEDVVEETNNNITFLRTEKSRILNKAGQANRDRSEAYDEYQKCEELLIDYLADLEEAEHHHDSKNNLTDEINRIEAKIEVAEKDRELYGDFVTQAEGVQEVCCEKYDMIMNRMNEQRFVKSELRKYLQTVDMLQRKLELYMNNDYTEFYNKPLERVQKLRDIIDNSVQTINKLVEASYISNEIIEGFPEFELPETKEYGDFGSRFKFDEKVMRDQMNSKGIDLAKRMKEKRKAEIESTYELL